MKLLLQSWAMIVFLLSGSTVISAEPITEQNPAYQSTLDNYQPLREESLADWQTLNQQAQSGGQAGHTMSSGKPGSPEMNHGNMDHATMNHGTMDESPSNQKGIGHGTMDHSAMGHGTPAPEKATANAPKSGNGPVTAKAMDHSAHTSQPSPSTTEPVHDHSGHHHSEPADAPVKNDHAADHIAQEEGAMHDHTGITHGDEGESMVTHESMETSEEVNALATKPVKTSVAKFEIIPNLHAVAVHFPIALTLLAFVFHLLAYIRKDHQNSAMLAAAGHYTLWVAAVSALITVLLGWQALNSIANHDDAGHAAMLLHRAWAIPTAVILALMAGWDAWRYKVTELISVPMVIVLFLVTQAIAVTAWLGGEVVYRHGIGVISISTPGQSTHDHAAGGHHAH
jgi:uncharacterized membrane protein